MQGQPIYLQLCSGFRTELGYTTDTHKTPLITNLGHATISWVMRKSNSGIRKNPERYVETVKTHQGICLWFWEIATSALEYNLSRETDWPPWKKPREERRYVNNRQISAGKSCKGVWRTFARDMPIQIYFSGIPPLSFLSLDDICRGRSETDYTRSE